MRSWILSLFSMEIRRVLSYRVDFWIHFVGNVFTQIGLAYFLWSSIFEYLDVKEMRGYTFPALMLYYLMVPLVDRMVRGSEMSQVAQEIYDGTLNRYLIYPVSFFLYRYTTHAAISLLFAGQFLLALLFFVLLFGIPAGVEFSPLHFLMGMGAVLLSGLLYFFLSTILEMVAFWADHVWSLVVMLRFVIYFSGGGMIPLSFFPAWSVKVLHWLPFPYLTSFPIRCFYGQIGFEEYGTGVVVILLWTAVLSLVARMVWNRGLRNYSGVGI